jgi:hypothetical protein
MAGLDPAISSIAPEEITGSKPGDDVNLEGEANRDSK